MDHKKLDKHFPNPVMTPEQERMAYYRGVIKTVTNEIWKRAGGRDAWKKQAYAVK